MTLLASVQDLYAQKGQARVQRISADPQHHLECLERASSEAWGYLTGRYPPALLPTTPEGSPPALKTAVCSIALALLADVHDVVDDALTEGRRLARAWLKDVQAGRVDLGLKAQPPEDSTRPQVRANRSVSDLKFGNGGLKTW